MGKRTVKELNERAAIFLKYLEEQKLKVDGVHDKAFYRDVYYTNFKVSRSDLDWRAFNFAAVLFPLKVSGRISFNDGLASFSTGRSRRGKRVTVDQDNTMSVLRKAADQKLPKYIEKEVNQYHCTVCKVKCTSMKDLRIHCRGKRHRLHVRVYDLNKEKSETYNKSDIMVSFVEAPDKESTNDSKYEDILEFDLEHEASPLDVTLDIHNQSTDHTICLLSCLLLRNYSVFTLSDCHKVTEGLTSLDIQPGESYEIQVNIDPKYIGSFLAHITLNFEHPEHDEFRISRKIVANVKNSTVKELEPVGVFVPPKRVPYEHVSETIDGIPLEVGESQLERDIPLDMYPIPKELRKFANAIFKATSLKNPMDRQRLSEILSMLKEKVTMGTHQERFHTLLYIEEIQMAVDIRKYDMENVTLRKNRSGRLLELKVPGLAENRPSVLRGDHVFLRKKDTSGKAEDKEYKGYVHVVGLDEVELGVSPKLMKEFLPNMKFHVRFTYNRVSIRVQHRAVELCHEHSLDRFLFPTPETTSAWGLVRRLEERIIFYNRDVEKNTEQALAVRHILAGSSRPAPYLIFGPPGTGKTVTVVEAMKQVCKCIPGTHILACAPSNSAADLLALRLLGHIESRNIMRLNALSRHWLTVPKEIQDMSNYDRHTGKYVYPSKQDLSKFKVIVCTLVTAGRLASANFPQGHFTHIFIDECGQAVEPEALIAIAGILEADTLLPNGGQIVLAGDPKQLGPILRSPFVLEHSFDKSLLERFMTRCNVYSRYNDPEKEESDHEEDSSSEQEESDHEEDSSSEQEESYQKSDQGQQQANNITPEIRNNHFYNPKVLTKLVRNYRSHPAILDLPNELFYKGELKPHADTLFRESFCQWEELPKKGFPMIFHGVTGNDMREAHSPSFFNPEEAAIVLKYIEKINQMKANKIHLKEIGVITPYRKQVQKIKTLLKKNHLDGITVGSVEEFQGQERRVIIVSTVRSNPSYLSFDVKFSLGFLNNPKRFNVAITRAKALLIVIGNPYVLAHDYRWRRLIEYCTKNGGYRGCDFTTDKELVDDITNRFDDVGLKDEETIVEEVAETMSGLNISDITHQEEPQWRNDI